MSNEKDWYDELDEMIDEETEQVGLGLPRKVSARR